MDRGFTMTLLVIVIVVLIVSFIYFMLEHIAFKFMGKNNDAVSKVSRWLG
jgi:uncharacterized membrane protein